jgi:hypothetical protein
MLRVVRGEPDDAELAALTVALLAATAAPPASGPVARSAWGDRSAAVRRPLIPGAGAWRASSLPR